MKVQGTVKPKSIESDEYHVYINTDIKELENGMYSYEQDTYSKDEYIAYLTEQLTNAQLALVEMYENTNGGEANG